MESRPPLTKERAREIALANGWIKQDPTESRPPLTKERAKEIALANGWIKQDPTEGNGWLARGASALGASPEVANTIEDVTNLPRRISKGVVQAGDMATYPVRKALEGLTGKDISTMESQGPKMATPKTAVGRVLHHAAEYGGEALGMAPLGVGLGAAAAAIPRLSTPGKWASKTISGASHVAGNPKNASELAKFTAAGAGVGGASGVLQEMGANPLVADIASGLGLAVGSVARTLYKLGHSTAKLTSIEKGVVADLTNNIGQDGLEELMGQLKVAPKSSISGYIPTTAEASGNASLSQMERAYGTGHIGPLADAQHQGTLVLEKELGNLAPENSSIGATQKHFSSQRESLESAAQKAASKSTNSVGKLVDPYLGKETREVTGERLQGIARRFLDKFKGERNVASKPHYDAFRESTDGIYANEARDYVKNLIEKEGIVGPQKSQIKRILKALEPNSSVDQSSLAMDLDYSQLQNRFGDLSPSALQNILNGIGVGGPLPNASQLDKTLTLIGEEIAIAKRAGKNSTARNLTGMKQALERDIAKVAPEVAQARAVYAEKSIPVSEITQGKGLRQAVEQDIYKTQHKVGAAELPNLFLRGEKAVENSRNLMKLIARDPESKALMKQYVYEDFIRHVTDVNGNVSLSKVNSYIKKNPAASIIDPRFKTNVMKIANAQKSAEQTKGALKNSAYLGKEKESYQAILGNNFEGLDPHNVIKSVFEGTNRTSRMSKIVQVASKDPESIRGLKKAAVDHIFNTINIKNPGSRNMTFIREHRGALSKLFDAEEMKIFDDISRALAARQKVLKLGSTTSSGTKANLTISAETKKMVLSKLGHLARRIFNMASPGVHLGDLGAAGLKLVKRELSNETTRGTERFLSHPDYAQSLLSRNKTAAEHTAKKSSATKEALSRPWLINRMRDEDQSSLGAGDAKRKPLRVEITQGTLSR